MKKKILILALAMICISVGVTGTFAFYTQEEQVHNVITTGNVSINLIETQADGSSFPVEEGIKGVMPGQSRSKIVKIENTGSADAWVRVKVNVSLLDENGRELPQTIQTDEKTIDVMSIDFLNGWVKDEDGYFYYKDPLKADEISVPLFESVSFAPEMDNRYQGCTAKVILSAEAVQSKNNPLPQNGNYSDITGWPGSDK